MMFMPPVTGDTRGSEKENFINSLPREKSRGDSLQKQKRGRRETLPRSGTLSFPSHEVSKVK